MQQYLTSKFTLILTAFGAALSIILNIASGTPALQLLFRTFISALILGGVAFLLQMLVARFIPQEHLDILFKGSSDQVPSLDDQEATGGKFDVTDDSELSAEDLYKSGSDDDEEIDNRSFSIPKKTNDEILNTTPKYNSTTGDTTDDGGPANPSSFQETDFSEAPRITPAAQDSSDSYSASSYSLGEEEKSIPLSGSGNMNTQDSDMDRPTPPSSGSSSSSKYESTSSSESSFQVGNKKISADPKIIAKAIKTVLSRDS